jgi:RNA exonuclease 1
VSAVQAKPGGADLQNILSTDSERITLRDSLKRKRDEEGTDDEVDAKKTKADEIENAALKGDKLKPAVDVENQNEKTTDDNKSDPGKLKADVGKEKEAQNIFTIMENESVNNQEDVQECDTTNNIEEKPDSKEVVEKTEKAEKEKKKDCSKHHHKHRKDKKDNKDSSRSKSSHSSNHRSKSSSKSSKSSSSSSHRNSKHSSKSKDHKSSSSSKTRSKINRSTSNVDLFGNDSEEESKAASHKKTQDSDSDDLVLSSDSDSEMVQACEKAEEEEEEVCFCYCYCLFFTILSLFWLLLMIE